jgi:hypothetical protein
LELDRNTDDLAEEYWDSVFRSKFESEDEEDEEVLLITCYNCGWYNPSDNTYCNNCKKEL